MGEWDSNFDRECRGLVKTICTAAGREREAAWQTLLLRASPHLEGWILRSTLLQRCRLATPDDARAVLVEVIERLAQRGFENLRRFLDAQPPAPGPDDELELSEVSRLARTAESDDDAAEAAADAPDTPLRGWLIGLLRFAVKDHIKKRLGWTARRPGEERAPSRRDLSTDADRLDDQPEAGERPPITDLMAMRQMLDRMRDYSATFPVPMRQALELWMQDVGFDEIAVRLGVEGPERSRALVRAAQARLRERFRPPA
jgi:DNA-directed RNA polymerase specialized sigma24 family protein